MHRVRCPERFHKGIIALTSVEISGTLSKNLVVGYFPLFWGAHAPSRVGFGAPAESFFSKVAHCQKFT
jgi:hypothetical protein